MPNIEELPNLGELGDAALACAKRGWSVAPAAPRGKNPIIKDWPNQASNDEEQVVAWWEEHPNANVAIVTGRKSGGLVAIDLDVHDGDETSLDFLHDWEAEHGELPETVTDITGGGGQHLYYYVDDAVQGSVNEELGIDIRGDGSCVIVPPSVHENGRCYEWEHPPDEVEVAHADENVLAFIAAVRPKDEKGRKPKTGAIGWDDFIVAGDEPRYELPEEIGKGGREAELHRYASSLQGKGYPDEVIYNAAAGVNATKCKPPLPSNEVEHAVETALRLDKGELRDSPAEEEPDFGNGEPAIIPVDLANAPEQKPELIAGMLREREVMGVGGATKVGKTWLLIELAVAAASGGEWLGCSCVQCRVLYIDGEMQEGTMFKRFRSVAGALGVPEDVLREHVDLLPMRGHAHSLHSLLKWLVDKVEGGGYSLVIVDPVYKFMEGDENSNGDVRDFLNDVDRLSQRLGCAVVFDQHHSKGAKGDVSPIDRMSGAGAFARSPDTVLDMTQVFPPSGTEPADFDVDEKTTVFRVEPRPRSFLQPPPFEVAFRWPLHTREPEGKFVSWSPMSSSNKGGKARGEKEASDRDVRLAVAEDVIAEMMAESSNGEVDGKAAYARFCEALPPKVRVCEKTFKNYVDKSTHYVRLFSIGTVSRWWIERAQPLDEPEQMGLKGAEAPAGDPSAPSTGRGVEGGQP